MGETLRSFGARFKDGLVSYWGIRRFAIEPVLVLDYAHNESIIHIGITLPDFDYQVVFPTPTAHYIVC